MKANELRIGNWLQYLTGEYFMVSSVDFKIIELTPSYLHPNPIPLTPEILEKCGFAFKPNGDEVYNQIWSFNQFEIWQHDEGFCHDFHFGGDIKHLHQLQNLYYSLTSEELIINL